MLDLVQPHLAGGSVSALVASPPGDEAGREGTLQHSEGSKTFALSRNEAEPLVQILVFRPVNISLGKSGIAESLSGFGGGRPRRDR